MDYDELVALRRGSAAWRLLRADHAPFVLGFLGEVFVEQGVRSISATDLAGQLDDELHTLRRRLGEDAFPKTAESYLADWAAPEQGWLRKYYPAGSDEPHFDATSSVEKALSWAESLRARSFVGTGSRLNTLFDLLRQMVHGAETDPQARLTELTRQRAELDAEIARVERGEIAVIGATGQRERYQQFAGAARELLADFREVEANFRALDRELRERVASWDGSKGDLLDEVLGDRSSIAESDQGRSFQAFYDFLLSPDRQQEFAELLDKVHRIEAIDRPDPRLRRIHHDWLDAGERTQATVRLLSEQLRRFLDNQVWLENRRVMDILHGIESNAFRLRGDTADFTCELDDLAPTVNLPMERPLYTPNDRPPIDSSGVTAADEQVDDNALFEQVYVDPERLAQSVRTVLRGGTKQVSLPELVARQPLEQGLAELVTYFSLTDEQFEVLIDEHRTDEVSWSTTDGTTRTATIPRVVFAETRK